MLELEAAGFSDVEAYDMISGARVTRAPETRHSWWLHLVAVKPGVPEGAWGDQRGATPADVATSTA